MPGIFIPSETVLSQSGIENFGNGEDSRRNVLNLCTSGDLHKNGQTIIIPLFGESSSDDFV